MKVLVVGHNCFSTSQSMGKTFCSLFSQFKKEEICQLYIYPTIPNIDFCDSSYRITDIDVLKGLFKFRVHGREIKREEIKTDCGLFENVRNTPIYRNKKNKTPFRKLARDFIWSLSPWFNKNLKIWLRRQNITHIFAAPGDQRFVYDLALKCADYLGVPIVTYICDEDFFVQPTSFIGHFQLFYLRKKIRQFMTKTSLLIAISEELKEAYGSFFSVKTEVIMTGASFDIQIKPKVLRSPEVLTYMGGLSCNRYVSLLDIGNALDEINEEYKTNYSIEIYSGDKIESVISEFKKVKSIHFMGFVAGEKFKEVFFSAETLLHVEAFDEESIDRVKNSISTKIADCLSSGIPLLAYGPNSIASIKHLKRNNCAFCIEKRESLKESLIQYLNLNPEERIDFVKRALKTACKYHDPNVVGKYVYNLIRLV